MSCGNSDPFAAESVACQRPPAHECSSATAAIAAVLLAPTTRAKQAAQYTFSAANASRAMTASAAGGATRTQARIHRVFEIGLVLKALHSVLEIIGGILLLAVSREYMLRIANLLTQEELLRDPNDRIAHYVVNLAHDLSTSAKTFAAFYLLSHGLIKLLLIVQILRKRHWAYPAFIIALGALIAYQSYKLLHGLSIGLAALTVLDAVVLVLTWHEYRVVRATTP
jgi:uncharacterized membrane protein